MTTLIISETGITVTSDEFNYSIKTRITPRELGLGINYGSYRIPKDRFETFVTATVALDAIVFIPEAGHRAIISGALTQGFRLAFDSLSDK